MLPPNTEHLKRYFFQQLNEPNMIKSQQNTLNTWITYVALCPLDVKQKP